MDKVQLERIQQVFENLKSSSEVHATIDRLSSKLKELRVSEAVQTLLEIKNEANLDDDTFAKKVEEAARKRLAVPRS
jgi:hypothetical protein